MIGREGFEDLRDYFLTTPDDQTHIWDFPDGLTSEVALQLTVVTRTIARSGVAESEKDVHAASVVPSETTAHETTAVRASSSNGP